MNNQSEQVQFDERVDLYLRGKMSEEEELAFEIEYLDNPDLLAQVEMVERLIHGLKLNEDSFSQAAQVAEPKARYQVSQQAAEASDSFISKASAWLGKWFTPQTAWGAVAATLFLVPLMSVINQSAGPALTNPAVQGTYVHLLGQRVRSANGAADTIFIEPKQQNLVVGFATEPTFGVPEPLTVTVYNADDVVVWQQQGLQPDYRWTVYLSVNTQAIAPGTYRYELTNGDTIVNSGSFAMQYSDGGH
ncbi:hypothetical protein [Halioxenophilus aromaticivorans]|uniref:Anti-sigma factor n=1 Tax=Halioxenophilus aromaticivorans TaxID=1306992 RepID=A0AAV3U558_9ALTE